MQSELCWYFVATALPVKMWHLKLPANNAGCPGRRLSLGPGLHVLLLASSPQVRSRACLAPVAPVRRGLCDLGRLCPPEWCSACPQAWPLDEERRGSQTLPHTLQQALCTHALQEIDLGLVFISITFVDVCMCVWFYVLCFCLVSMPLRIDFINSKSVKS